MSLLFALTHSRIALMHALTWGRGHLGTQLSYAFKPCLGLIPMYHGQFMINFDGPYWTL